MKPLSLSQALNDFLTLLKDDVVFVLTNRVPRAALTRWMGWFSKIEQPWVRDWSLAVWQRFANLRLHEARKTSFTSVHDCFIRELKEGVRPVNPAPGIMTSPCDGIIGAMGQIKNGLAIQAKGLTYPLAELLVSHDRAAALRDGVFVTLRITPAMYHRFHAPGSGTIEQVGYVAGDTWNVNPVSVRRIPWLYCRNERAVLELRLEGTAHRLMIVPVAAILVAGLRLHGLPNLFDARYEGPREIPCNLVVRKGTELGWFQHGSTIIVFAPAGFGLLDHLRTGDIIRVGEALLGVPVPSAPDVIGLSQSSLTMVG